MSNISILQSHFYLVDDFENIKKLKIQTQNGYVECAISIKYYDEELLGFNYWDCVDELWYYILKLADEYSQKGVSIITFPDQPLKLKIEKIDSKICKWSLLSKNAINQHYLFEGSLIKNILENGIYFFQCLNMFMHGNYSEEINYAKYLTEKLYKT